VSTVRDNRDIGAFCPVCDGWKIIMSLECATQSEINDLYRKAAKYRCSVREFDLELLRNGTVKMCGCGAQMTLQEPTT
jgi:hypothetical protein